MESRRVHPEKSATLPLDYLKMVNDVFTTNFDAGLKALAKIKPGPEFQAEGRIYSDEVVLSLSLVHKDAITATTAHASMDFDPKANSPTVEDLLAICVDALGSIWTYLLDTTEPNRIEQTAAETLAVMKDIPFSWTKMEVSRRQVFLKVDKSNPNLDRMTDDWLAKHDPDHKARQKREAEETEKLFVTGPSSPKKPVRH